MKKLEVNLNGSRDEILKEVKELKEYFSSFNILDDEMKRTGEAWKLTGKRSYWDAFTNYSVAELKKGFCKSHLLTIEVTARNNIAGGIREKTAQLFRESYAEFVDLYEAAEKAEQTESEN